MRKIVIAFAASIAFAGSASAWTHPDNSEGPDDNGSLPNAWSIHDRGHAALGEIAMRLRKGDTNYSAIAEHLRVVVEDISFPTLTEQDRHYAWLAYGGALFNSGQFERARTALQNACAMPQATATDWEYRLKNSVALQDFTDAARAAMALAKNWPERIAHYDGHVFVTILAETRKSPQTAGLADDLLAALTAAHWDASSQPAAG